MPARRLLLAAAAAFERFVLRRGADAVEGPPPVTREEAAALLDSRNNDAVVPAIRYFSARPEVVDADIKARIVRALEDSPDPLFVAEAIYPFGAAMAGEVRGLLARNPRPEVRCHALCLLGKWGEADMVHHLREFARVDCPDMILAMRVLVQHGDPCAAPLLCEAIVELGRRSMTFPNTAVIVQFGDHLAALGVDVPPDVARTMDRAAETRPWQLRPPLR